MFQCFFFSALLCSCPSFFQLSYALVLLYAILLCSSYLFFQICFVPVSLTCIQNSKKHTIWYLFFCSFADVLLYCCCVVVVFLLCFVFYCAVVLLLHCYHIVVLLCHHCIIALWLSCYLVMAVFSFVLKISPHKFGIDWIPIVKQQWKETGIRIPHCCLHLVGQK